MSMLRAYLNTLPVKEQHVFASKCGTTTNYLRKAISLGQIFSPKLVVSFEKNSRGALNRKDFHPTDYQDIWPELK